MCIQTPQIKKKDQYPNTQRKESRTISFTVKKIPVKKQITEIRDQQINSWME